MNSFLFCTTNCNGHVQLKTEEEKAAILNSLSRPFAICVENFFFLGLFHKTPISNLEKFGRKVRSLEEI